jgi:hypothetical protein
MCTTDHQQAMMAGSEDGLTKKPKKAKDQVARVGTKWKDKQKSNQKVDINRDLNQIKEWRRKWIEFRVKKVMK